jgi:PAS domain-containing protein
MATTFLAQFEEWYSELQELENRLASTSPHDIELQEELRVTIEALEAQRSNLVDETAPSDTNRSETERVHESSRGIFVTTPNGVVTEANSVGQLILNLPGRRLLGQPLLAFIATEQRRTFLEKLVHFKHYPHSLQAEWHRLFKPVNGVSFRAVTYVTKTLGHDREVFRLTWLVRPLQ